MSFAAEVKDFAGGFDKAQSWLDKAAQRRYYEARAQYYSGKGGTGAPGEGDLSGQPGFTPGSAKVDPGGGSGRPSKVDISGMDKNQVFNGFMNAVKTGVTNPYALAAIAATGAHESAFSPSNAAGDWQDGVNRAGGVMSWNGERLAKLRAANGGQNGSPEAQGMYFLKEDPALIQKLNAAKSLDEAQSLMNGAWQYSGYDPKGDPNGRARLATANSFLPRFESGENAADKGGGATPHPQDLSVYDQPPPADETPSEERPSASLEDPAAASAARLRATGQRPVQMASLESPTVPQRVDMDYSSAIAPPQQGQQGQQVASAAPTGPGIRPRFASPSQVSNAFTQPEEQQYQQQLQYGRLFAQSGGVIPEGDTLPPWLEPDVPDDPRAQYERDRAAVQARQNQPNAPTPPPPQQDTAPPAIPMTAAQRASAGQPHPALRDDPLKAAYRQGVIDTVAQSVSRRAPAPGRDVGEDRVSATPQPSRPVSRPPPYGSQTEAPAELRARQGRTKDDYIPPAPDDRPSPYGSQTGAPRELAGGPTRTKDDYIPPAPDTRPSPYGSQTEPPRELAGGPTRTKDDTIPPAIPVTAAQRASLAAKKNVPGRDVGEDRTARDYPPTRTKDDTLSPYGSQTEPPRELAGGPTRTKDDTIPPEAAPGRDLGPRYMPQQAVSDEDLQALRGITSGPRNPPNAPAIPVTRGPQPRQAITDTQRERLAELTSGPRNAPQPPPPAETPTRYPTVAQDQDYLYQNELPYAPQKLEQPYPYDTRTPIQPKQAISDQDLNRLQAETTGPRNPPGQTLASTLRPRQGATEPAETPQPPKTVAPEDTAAAAEMPANPPIPIPRPAIPPKGAAPAAAPAKTAAAAPAAAAPAKKTAPSGGGGVRTQGGPSTRTAAQPAPARYVRVQQAEPQPQGGRMLNARSDSPRIYGGSTAEQVAQSRPANPLYTRDRIIKQGVAAQATHSGLGFLQHIFGFDQPAGAINDPTAQAVRQRGARAFSEGIGAATPEQVKTIDNTIGNDQEASSDKQINRLSQTFNYYMSRGNKKAASMTAGSLLLYGAQRVSQLATMASGSYAHYQETGDPQALQHTLDFMNRAYEYIPDGSTLEMRVDPRSHAIVVTSTDVEGNQQEHALTAQELPQYIRGAMDKSSYWQRINEIHDPAGARAALARADKLTHWAQTRTDKQQAAAEKQQVTETKTTQKAAADKAKQIDWTTVRPLLAAAKQASDALDANPDDPAAKQAYGAAASALQDALPSNQVQPIFDKNYLKSDFQYTKGGGGGSAAAPAPAGQIPPRPAGVPADARYDRASKHWIKDRTVVG